MFKMDEDGSNPVNITPPGIGQVFDVALSPDGTRIAFVANRSRYSYLSEYFDERYHEIYMMNADGSDMVNLTQNQIYDDFPVWSSDGERLAFISKSEDFRDKNIYLHLIPAWLRSASEGVTYQAITPIHIGEGLADTPPAWSPDGKKFAYLADDAFRTLNIIYAYSNGPSVGGGFPIGGEPGRDRAFDWSPNGSQIVFQLSKFESGGIVLLDVVENTTQPISAIGKSPTWSPDGKRIAFVSRSSTDKDEVSVMNADGSNVTLLTPNSNWDDVFELAWSPGGSKLLFVARQGENEQIYRVNADGSNLTPLSEDRGVVFRRIAWASSPVGPDAAVTKPASALADNCNRFAFVSAKVDIANHAFGTLFVKNINGSDMFPLFFDSVPWSQDDGFPSIVGSPDGRLLAFGSGSFITVGNIETLDFVEIRNDAYPQIGEPAWSPDSRKIAFSFEKDGAMEIGVTDAAGGRITNLTRNPANDHKPAWSPDGRKIAFLSTRDGASDLYVMNADGSKVTRLTQNMFTQGFPAWSPNGSKIAFSDGNAIYEVNADGSGLNNLTFNSGNSAGRFLFTGSPVWSPDGLKIAFRADVLPFYGENIPKDGLQSLIVFSNPRGWYFSARNNEELLSNGRKAEIFVMNADGSNPLNLTNDSVDDDFPVWSPDGSKILFETGRGMSQIYIMDADGSNPIALTNRPEYLYESPAWIPCPPSN
jgi:TolB protein